MTAEYSIRNAQQPSGMPFQRYTPFIPIDLADRTWPTKRATQAPRWCAVDLRDGNQALAQPMSVEEKLEYFAMLVRIGFNIPLNDTTNAFKAYRRTVIDGCRPFLAPHFNLTVEMPLKAIVRGYTYAITPISWRNRRHGVAKLKIKEMGSRYFFICAYVWLEKYFSRGDYRRK